MIDYIEDYKRRLAYFDKEHEPEIAAKKKKDLRRLIHTSTNAKRIEAFEIALKDNSK